MQTIKNRRAPIQGTLAVSGSGPSKIEPFQFESKREKRLLDLLGRLPGLRISPHLIVQELQRSCQRYRTARACGRPPTVKEMNKSLRKLRASLGEIRVAVAGLHRFSKDRAFHWHESWRDGLGDEKLRQLLDLARELDEGAKAAIESRRAEGAPPLFIRCSRSSGRLRDRPREFLVSDVIDILDLASNGMPPKGEGLDNIVEAVVNDAPGADDVTGVSKLIKRVKAERRKRGHSLHDAARSRASHEWGIDHKKTDCSFCRIPKLTSPA